MIDAAQEREEPGHYSRAPSKSTLSAQPPHHLFRAAHQLAREVDPFGVARNTIACARLESSNPTGHHRRIGPVLARLARERNKELSDFAQT